MRKGGAFRLVGLILGIAGMAISVTALVFSIVGIVMGRHIVAPRVRK